MKKYTNFMISKNMSIETLLEKHKKLLVIFWHPRCKPCQKIVNLVKKLCFKFLFYF